jgi:predicted RND superfamily exporter protein
VIAELMSPPLGLKYDEAVRRLEGTLVGPPQRNAEGRSLGDGTRFTCLVANLAPAATRSSVAMREAVDHITHVAQTECGIDPATIHMGGPPVDALALDVETRRTMARTAAMAAVAGIVLCYWRLHSWKLTAIVFGAGATSGLVSLAIVYYCGAFEVLALGRASPRMGVLDMLVIATPAIVYVVGLTGALYAIHAYRRARRDGPPEGAAERAADMSWAPMTLAASTLAAGFAVMCASCLAPLQRVGLFTAAGALASIGVVLAVVPVCLHRFPLSHAMLDGLAMRSRESRIGRSFRGLFQWSVQHRALSLLCWAAVMAVLASGLMKTGASIDLATLVDERAQITRDHAWLDQRLGHLAPLEVIVTIPPERLRAPHELAERDGQQYRLTMVERVELMRDLQKRVEGLPMVSGALSAATFAPRNIAATGRRADRAVDYAVSKSLEQHRKLLLASDFMQLERRSGIDETTGRELWRLTARVATPGREGGSEIGYGDILRQLRDAVDPLLLAYQQRDRVTQTMHEQGKHLAGSQVCVLFRAPHQTPQPPEGSQESLLATLLGGGGAAPRSVTYFNLATYDQPHRKNLAQDDEYRRAAISALAKQDAVLLLSAASDPTVKTLAASGVPIADLTQMASVEESIADATADAGGPRPIRAVFTGSAPILDRTEREFAATMPATAAWAAALVGLMLLISLRSVAAGIAAAAACALPVVAIPGALGWAGVGIDVGVVLAIGAAMAVIVAGSIHFLTWFLRSVAAGFSRAEAIVDAYDRTAEPLVQSTLIAGIGLSVLALSTFSPLQYVGYLALATLAVGLAGNLLVLPALLASPLGLAFRTAEPAERRPSAAKAPAAAIPAPHLRTAVPTSDAEPAEAAPALRARPAISADDRRDVAHGPHSALHAKLQELRRAASRDTPDSAEA